MSFSELLKQCRKKQGVSQAELASRLGVTQQAVGKWESGKSSPDPSTVARIAELLNTTADYLLGLYRPVSNVSAPEERFFGSYTESLIPVIGTVKAGYGALAFEEDYGQEYARVKDPSILYVIGETNLETHGTWQKLGADGSDEWTLPGARPEWRENVLARAEAMLERDKNHPAILIWSCGNESQGGKTLWEMSEYFRRTDPSRLVHYEGIFWNREYPATSDMESQMYTPVADIKKFLAEHPEKPFIMCEYSHAMGNSNGGITDYTEYAYEESLYQGGFTGFDGFPFQ